MQIEKEKEQFINQLLDDPQLQEKTPDIESRKKYAEKQWDSVIQARISTINSLVETEK